MTPPPSPRARTRPPIRRLNPPEMYDNLAKIFLNRKEEDWLGLLASSEQWPQLKDGFFARLKVRAGGGGSRRC